MKIEIITHCWAGQLRQYATMLRCQLASLSHYPPQDCNVTVSVCYSSSDAWTVDVLNDALSWFNGSTVELNPVGLPLPKLFRRAIGRNRVAKASTADVVWFTDCDYLFGNGCLDALGCIARSGQPLTYPRIVNIHNDHATGDKWLREVESAPRGFVPPISPDDFKPSKTVRAIGGVMIVTAEVAAMGFCDKSKRMQRPREPNEGWQQSRCDRCARMEWGFGTGKKIELPEVYRLRHSKISYPKRDKMASHD